MPYCVASALARSGPDTKPSCDDRFTKPLARRLLQNEGALELVVGQKTLFDEQASKGTPGDAGRFHSLDIGAVGPGDKRFLTRCLFTG